MEDRASELAAERTRLERQRETEDQAIDLGAQRADLEQRLSENTEAILALFDAAGEVGIPAEQFARLVGVSRQSLYRWREVARRLRESRESR